MDNAEFVTPDEAESGVVTRPFQGYCGNCGKAADTLPCPHCSVDMRYVRIRCPYCQAVSPTVDQREDPHRKAMSDWWFDHRNEHILTPVVEVAPRPQSEREATDAQ